MVGRRPRRFRPWLASIAAAAALNVELVGGTVGSPRGRTADRIVWVARRSAQAEGFDDREVIDSRAALVVACDLTTPGREPGSLGAEIGPN